MFYKIYITLHIKILKDIYIMNFGVAITDLILSIIESEKSKEYYSIIHQNHINDISNILLGKENIRIQINNYVGDLLHFFNYYSSEFATLLNSYNNNTLEEREMVNYIYNIIENNRANITFSTSDIIKNLEIKLKCPFTSIYLSSISHYDLQEHFFSHNSVFNYYEFIDNISKIINIISNYIENDEQYDYKSLIKTFNNLCKDPYSYYNSMGLFEDTVRDLVTKLANAKYNSEVENIKEDLIRFDNMITDFIVEFGRTL